MILKLKLFIYTYDFHRQLNQDYLDHYHEQQGVLTKGNISIESGFFFQAFTYMGEVDFQCTTTRIDIGLKK
jgi:hypothetical protein